MNQQFCEKDIIDGIRIREDAVFEYLRTKHFNCIASIVISNSGTMQDAQDLYNTGILNLIEIVDRPKFIFTSKVSTLLISICKRQWLTVLEKRRVETKNQMALGSESYEEDYEEKLDREFIRNILWTSFSKLPGDCKTILKGYLKEMKVAEIAELMDLTPSNVKRKKHYCYKHLMKLISEHPDYKKMINTQEILIDQ